MPTEQRIEFLRMRVLGAAALVLVVMASPAAAQTCDYYEVTESSTTPVAGTADIGNSCDDCTTNIALPFAVAFYNGVYNSANVSSNGNLQFVTADTTWTNSCSLPFGAFDVAILPHWDDLRTDFSGTDGIFTAITGIAPARSFIIEWRATYFNNTAISANFAVVLHEDTANFEVIYGTVGQGGSGATIGAQDGPGALATIYSCDTAGSAITGRMLSFTCADVPLAVEVPTLSGSGMTALVAALLAIGIVALRRRRAA